MHKKLITSFILSVFAFSCASSGESLRQIPRSQRKGLVVLNFINNTPKSRAAEYQPWEFGLASMLMTDIEAIGMFNIVGKERLKDIIKEQEFHLSGMVDPANIAILGKLVGADYVLTGTFMEMGGTLRLESQVFSVENGAQLGTASVTGKTEEAKKAVAEAKVSFEKAIEADPGYKKAKENLSKVSLAIPISL